MKSDMYRLVFGILMALLICTTALADGMFIPSAKELEKSSITEPEQKAAIYYSKGVETLIISPSYKGSARNFAWVIPVPSRPQVSVVDGALFHELKTLTNPPARQSLSTDSFPGGMIGSAAKVQVLERKTVGAYDVSVLRSNDANALTKWLKQNGYQIPEPDKFVRERISPIPYYIRKHWTFVACRVKVPQKAVKLQIGSLAPIKLVFKSKQIIYPMKLSSLSKADFSLLVYLLLPTDEFKIRDFQYGAVDSPKDAQFAMQCGMLKQKQTQYPTLAKLSGKEIKVFRLNSHMQPYSCNKDIVWVPK